MLPPGPPEKIPLSFLVNESLTGNAKMQKLLYDKYALPMYGVCFRYLKHSTDAEDVLQEGFIKVFKNLGTFKQEGSFEGWIRRIMVRTALTHIRDNKKHARYAELQESIPSKVNVHSHLAEKDIMGSVTLLPPVSKKIFILYAIEGYNHREIAAILGCSEGTSKSQFYRSRNRLQQMLNEK